MGFSREHCTHILREEHEKNIKDAAARQERNKRVLLV
jgi:hypothetical protein